MFLERRLRSTVYSVKLGDIQPIETVVRPTVDRLLQDIPGPMLDDFLNLRYLGIVLLLGLSGLGLPIPEEVVVVTAGFLSHNGDLTADVEVEYELMLTQRWHILPRAELGWSAQDIPELGKGSGVTSGQFGVRLAYDVVREFAPFVGVEWQGSFGETENMLSAAGETTDQTVFVVGFHAWY